MGTLTGLMIFCGLLYWWIIGHWFARILVTLALSLSLLYVALFLMEMNHAAAGARLLVALLLLCSTWFIGGAPTYYWRHRMRFLREEQRRHIRAAG